MNYKFNGKTIRIPDSAIELNMKSLGMTKEEAIELWLEDEGYLENEEQEALCRKAKENNITQTIHGAEVDKAKKKTQKERVQKENPTKELVIAKTFELLQTFAENVQIVNKNKLIEFDLNGKHYKFDLIEQRTKKKE